jgi:hypothetical protein
MSNGTKQDGDNRSKDRSHKDPAQPVMSSKPGEQGRIWGEENAAGGQSVGTGGHGDHSGCGVNCGKFLLLVIHFHKNDDFRWRAASRRI